MKLAHTPIYEYTQKDIDKTHKIYCLKNGLGVSVAFGKDVPGGDATGFCTFAVIRWDYGASFSDYKIAKNLPISVINYLPDSDVDMFISIVEGFGNDPN